MMQIHEKIKQARLSARLTQQEIADKIGIKRSTYQYWEQETPSMENIKQVQIALKLPDDYFFVNSDEGTGKEETPGRVYLEESVRYLSMTEMINAKNIERLIGLLEMQANSNRLAKNPQEQIHPEGNDQVPFQDLDPKKADKIKKAGKH